MPLAITLSTTASDIWMTLSISAAYIMNFFVELVLAIGFINRAV